MPPKKRSASDEHDGVADAKPVLPSNQDGQGQQSTAKKRRTASDTGEGHQMDNGNAKGKEKIKGEESDDQGAENDEPNQSSRVEIEKNDDGDSFFKLSEYRRVTVRAFKGKTLVDIREVYKDKATGVMKPGAKGISLTPEQWSVLKSNFAQVDEMMSSLAKSK